MFPISVEFNFTKKLEGRDLKAGEFTFELKDSDNVVIATATNDASGNFKFTPVDYTNKAGKTVTALKYQKGQEGTYTYTVTEVKGTDSTVTYDEMAAVVTVKVSHDGTAKALITNVTEPADKGIPTTVSLHQQNLSSNQRNTLFLKRNSISQVRSSLMTILN